KFAPWDWFILIGDSAQFILDEFHEQRHRMERALSDTIESVQLAGSGFVFILDEQGQSVTPLATHQHQLLDSRLKEHPATPLKETLLSPQQLAQQDTYFVETSQSQRKQPIAWQIKAHYLKPLKWTIAAAVPTQEVIKP